MSSPARSRATAVSVKVESQTQAKTAVSASVPLAALMEPISRPSEDEEADVALSASNNSEENGDRDPDFGVDMDTTKVRAGGGRSRVKSSKYRGVSRCSKDGRWQARLRVGKSVVYLGRFPSEEEAAQVYDKGALMHYGAQAATNFDASWYTNGGDLSGSDALKGLSECVADRLRALPSATDERGRFSLNESASNEDNGLENIQREKSGAGKKSVKRVIDNIVADDSHYCAGDNISSDPDAIGTNDAVALGALPAAAKSKTPKAKFPRVGAKVDVSGIDKLLHAAQSTQNINKLVSPADVKAQEPATRNHISLVSGNNNGNNIPANKSEQNNVIGNFGFNPQMNMQQSPFLVMPFPYNSGFNGFDYSLGSNQSNSNNGLGQGQQNNNGNSNGMGVNQFHANQQLPPLTTNLNSNAFDQQSQLNMNAGDMSRLMQLSAMGYIATPAATSTAFTTPQTPQVPGLGFIPFSPNSVGPGTSSSGNSLSLQMQNRFLQAPYGFSPMSATASPMSLAFITPQPNSPHPQHHFGFLNAGFNQGQQSQATPIPTGAEHRWNGLAFPVQFQPNQMQSASTPAILANNPGSQHGHLPGSSLFLEQYQQFQHNRYPMMMGNNDLGLGIMFSHNNNQTQSNNADNVPSQQQNSVQQE